MRTPRRTPATGAEPSSLPPVRGRRAHAGPPADEYTDPDDDVTETQPEASTRAGRWRIRPRTVRAKIVCLLMVPVVSLLALWAYATVSTAQDVARLRQVQRVDSTVRAPVDDAVAALQTERAAAVRYATDPSSEPQSDLKTLAQHTDQAVAKLRLGDHNTVADGADLPAGVARRLDAFVNGAENLETLRTAVLERRTRWDEAYGQYTRTISAAFAVDGALTGIQDADLGSDARVLLEFSRAGEALAQEDTVLSGARLAHTLDGERLRLFTGAVGTRRTLTDAAVADLRGPEQASWRDLAAGSAYADVRAVEDRVLASRPGGNAVDAAPEADWNTAHARVRDAMRAIEAKAGRGVADRADPLTRGLLTPAGAAVVFGLAAVAASLVISVRIGRGLVVELVLLRNSALEIARRKLPDAMRKLRAGEEIDVRAEAPPGPPAEDETGQVAEALGTVHRAALRAAVERAELASGISGVFVNLARRSQVLVHRQLSLLDSMERRSEDPNELSDLFRLDHLTTRMRRHAESLIILSGAAPGRAWRMPVSLTNVVRAAVSEVEDYARVEVRQLPEASVGGAAVADLTHLLAEVVENAAQFSPPHTRVRITGEPVGNGYAVEVEDRGLGMGQESLDEANRRIEQSEALDLFDSDRLGLFVVSRLAARHGIKVHLRTSPYGGTTAVVLLPTALLHGGAAERSPRKTENGRPDEREYARVSAAPEHDSVQAPIERPALVPLVQTAVEPPAPSSPEASANVSSETPVNASPETPPPGVTTLRLHRPSDDSEGSDDLPRRVRQASLAPQLREQRIEESAQVAAHQHDDARTPELVRDRMAAYRDGWARGGGRTPGRGATPDPDAGSDSSEGDPA
ncbi:nitrate- and nitrite sensing domain-containing protein [Streptomyces sp. NBC_01340]|uniref:sensor histidine kinase n=1 Tax=unclassified Streptomyces TaxID=2593676 RepID=UPI002251AD96|nr:MULTISPECIES: nitrate- and nitrite sensing domain-containing protein [unclassified Streptomyces]MCX4452275.1 nitrate- and nitrite sensing domain-containing protein [Streptomyces sp. NBC_01719]MCX4491635.1 nitrate- and nitrite sensing domain-containing protein [Streptomyces sp. NBC_01728]MCX4593790.1 nitrate- and nitrite sensing domain-containing protein [Streptomyces sp. NBC_01549]WSI36933.1 nitrate- and nitrite sensing domain-containing protein [Streptomyces sp. NBC_01340]